MVKKNNSSAAATSNKKKKRVKSLISAPEAASRKGLKPSTKENPFESIWSRRKFNVIGKKRKGEERRVGLARSLAVQKRNKTLLKDYEQSRKSSVFLDKRIGESDEQLAEFDKAILRLQRERQLRFKRESKYNLSDEEEGGIDGGDYFSNVDDFEDEIPLDDEEDGDNEAKRSSKDSRHISLHNMQGSSETSLPVGDENVHKTKKQIYGEIMAKSKFHKALKAKDKEDDERLMEELDKDFASLAQSEALLSLTQPTKMNALKALLNKSDTVQYAKEGLSGPTHEDMMKTEKPDAYDMLVKEMVLDARARPSDRKKTPEEVAQEERERLELLEEERQKRMLAIEDSEDESDDDAHNLRQSTKKLQHVSGDDLGDSISADVQLPNKTGWVDDILGRKDGDDGEDEGSSSDDGSENEGSDEDIDAEGENSDDDGGSGSESENLLDMKGWEESDDDQITDEVEKMEDSGRRKKRNDDKERVKCQATDSLTASKAKSSEKLTTAKNETLPFVIEAPNSLNDLCSLLDNRSDTEILEAINRIRTCNAIRLAAENRRKMQVFYGVLLQYFAMLSTKKPLNFKLINLLVRPLMEMSTDTPYFAAICARQRLMRTRAQFCEDLKDPEKSSWPSLKTLLLLRLWSLIFPCSDFRHVVMTPATSLMCEYLMRCHIMNGRDIAVGSFLCSMILSVARQSNKFYPEAVVFLQVLLITASNMKQELLQLSQCYHFMDIKTLKPWLCIRKQASEVHPVDFFTVMDMPIDSEFFETDNFRVGILASVIETIRGFVRINERLSSFPETFLPIAGLLHEVLKQEGMPDLLRGNMEDVTQLIKKKVDEHLLLRQPLQMRKQKPIPLKLLNPKFEEDYIKGRDYDPDRERVERKKLKKLLKREAKGASRELRKDNYFLFEAKEKDRLLQEEERAEKYGKARAILQEQEHAFKSGQLGKGRKRRR